MAETLMGWLVPDRVVYALARASSLEENRLATNRAVQLMEESSAEKVHHIIDQSRFQPTMVNVDLGDVSQDLSRMLRHPKLGWVLTCYGDNLFVQYVNWLLTHENQARSQHFDNAQAAVDFLLGVDETLPEIPNLEAFMKDFRR